MHFTKSLIVGIFSIGHWIECEKLKSKNPARKSQQTIKALFQSKKDIQENTILDHVDSLHSSVDEAEMEIPDDAFESNFM